MPVSSIAQALRFNMEIILYVHVSMSGYGMLGERALSLFNWHVIKCECNEQQPTEHKHTHILNCCRQHFW